MSSTITWQVTQTDYNTDNKFIFCAHWNATAVDGDYTASVYSTVSFPEGTPSIPYDQVTQAEVLNWVWANGVSKDATEAALAAQIELQKHPVTATGLPWATA